jgi:hypothetical protein
MIGALRAVWPWRTELESNRFSNYLPELNVSLVAALIFMTFGYMAVIQLEKAGIAREHDDL